jgi:hypothetical protein
MTTLDEMVLNERRFGRRLMANMDKEQITNDVRSNKVFPPSLKQGHFMYFSFLPRQGLKAKAGSTKGDTLILSSH